MKLIDTIELMSSNDYKERFLAEYYQTKIRYYPKVSKLIMYNYYVILKRILQFDFEKASKKIRVAIRKPVMKASAQLVQQNSLYISVYFFSNAFSSSLSFANSSSSALTTLFNCSFSFGDNSVVLNWGCMFP